MLSASNMPVPDEKPGHVDGTSLVLLLPAFSIIDNVSPSNVHELITEHIDTAPTNRSTLIIGDTEPLPTSIASAQHPQADSTSILKARPCPHKYLILLCSQKTRDARCGQSAPLLRKELERHLQPLGLYRDLHDERPGGVGIYFISHVGGHKYSANMLVYRRADADGIANDGAASGSKEAAQCIWLARIRPEDCENVVRYTVLQGKVVKPGTQLRGGFDRSRQLASW
ncbi:hypothetical protein MRB53_039725 [Persea americana]|nr:hypothetical protein MRB53_039725 [Persea americana]